MQFELKKPAIGMYDIIIFSNVALPYPVLINWLLFGRRFLTEGSVFWQANMVTIPGILTVYWIQGLINKMIRAKFSDFRHAFKRGIILSGILFFINAGFVTAIFYCFDKYHFLHYTLQIKNYYWALVTTFLINIISVGMSEGSYALSQWKKISAEAESFKKISLQNQLDRLKEQVNSHFLFNSLNCLSALVTENSEKAGFFLNDLSKVYRYLLSNNENSLTSLTKEINFIYSYYHLLKTRYNDGIDLCIQIPDGYMHYLIPPLTLQLLVENAIKHNVILRETPLKIHIMGSENNTIIIKNSIQQKSTSIPSTKIGLKNIILKYKLLNQPDIIISNSDLEFSVTIPLINKGYEIV